MQAKFITAFVNSRCHQLLLWKLESCVRNHPAVFSVTCVHVQRMTDLKISNYLRNGCRYIKSSDHKPMTFSFKFFFFLLRTKWFVSFNKSPNRLNITNTIGTKWGKLPTCFIKRERKKIQYYLGLEKHNPTKSDLTRYTLTKQGLAKSSLTIYTIIKLGLDQTPAWPNVAQQHLVQ